MQRFVLVLIWLSVAATVVGFFLPWARIDVRQPALMKQVRETVPGHEVLGELTKKLSRVTVEIHRGTETITGELPNFSDIPSQVSGVQIPQMANQPHAQVAEALLELFTTTRQRIGAKSYAVYLVPGIAVLCGALLTLFGRIPAVAIGIAALCAAIAGVGFWKLLTTDMDMLFIAITIGPGVWGSLWAYATLAIAAGLSGMMRNRALN